MSSHGRCDSADLYGLKSVFSEVVSTRKRNPTHNSHNDETTVKRRKVCSDDDTTSTATTTSSLPDPKSHTGSPTAFLCDLFQAMHGIRLQVRKTSEWKSADFFQPSATEAQIAAYTIDIVNMVRENQVDDLRSTYYGKDKDAATTAKVHCRNAFGESLLHRACRLGHNETTQFLLQDAQVNVRVVDDYGRTPLHDTCWNPTPQLQICEWLLQQDPFLCLVADKRGFSPFDYARSHHWLPWKEFLYQNRHYLDAMLQQTNTLALFTEEEKRTATADDDEAKRIR